MAFVPERTSPSSLKTAVIGGGLVGALQACFFAKRGFQVDLYEAREDIRTLEVVKGRSINLALSIRGREALRHVGLEKEVIRDGIPMFARGIHSISGDVSRHPYDKDGQAILSVDRRMLNETLLTAAEKNDKVNLHFDHKLIRADFDKGEVTFTNGAGDEIKATYDLIIGADGAFSAVRRQMMRTSCIDFSQKYIPHGYMEIYIPPSTDGGFAMGQNFLHIWPRDEFMMIALPNKDGTFTGTLFMPFNEFDAVHAEGEEGVMKHFKKYYPDVIPLVGEENLKKTFMESKGLPMVTIKCSPYHYKDKVVIIGDAAHAMVPFYGQGMNCGFEDCIVLDNMLDKHQNDIMAALKEYSEVRNPDAKAMCDLAVYNYVEMRHLVNSKIFLLKKKVDNFLYWLFPRSYIPLYNMVTFSRIRYSVVIKKWKSQQKFVKNLFLALLVILPVATGILPIAAGMTLTPHHIPHRWNRHGFFQRFHFRSPWGLFV